MQKGERIKVTAMKADGTPYRWFHATVEAVEPDRVITYAAAGSPVYEPGGSWAPRPSIRTHFWLDRPYNLLELFEADMTPTTLYVHIASRPIMGQGEIRYYDYELDVVKRPGEPAQVIDQNEFAAAVVRYGYTPTFQEDAWKAVNEALKIVESWRS